MRGRPAIDRRTIWPTISLMDRLSPNRRSALMSKVRAKDTVPELVVRRLLHRLGYRFRLHRKDLPGTPDIVLPAHRKIILVNGCYWHGHGCRYGQLPKSNLEFWSTKIEANRARDDRNVRWLGEAGWEVLTVWQCETKDNDGLEKRLIDFLKP